MKATGIVRRMDDLGRVVIPKEIRRVLRMPTGTPLEFYTQEGQMVLKKYAPMKELDMYAQDYAEAIYETTGANCIISDTKTVVAIAGTSKKEYNKKPIGSFPYEVMENHLVIESEGRVEIVPNDENEYTYVVGSSIISNQGMVGTVILFSKEENKNGEIEKKMASSTAKALGIMMS